MSNSKKIVPSDAPSSAPARRQRRISDREVIQEEEESQDTDTSSHKTRKKQSAKDMNATQRAASSRDHSRPARKRRALRTGEGKSALYECKTDITLMRQQSPTPDCPPQTTTLDFSTTTGGARQSERSSAVSMPRVDPRVPSSSNSTGHRVGPVDDVRPSYSHAPPGWSVSPTVSANHRPAVPSPAGSIPRIMMPAPVPRLPSYPPSDITAHNSTPALDDTSIYSPISRNLPVSRTDSANSGSSVRSSIGPMSRIRPRVLSLSPYRLGHTPRHRPIAPVDDGLVYNHTYQGLSAPRSHPANPPSVYHLSYSNDTAGYESSSNVDNSPLYGTFLQALPASHPDSVNSGAPYNLIYPPHSSAHPDPPCDPIPDYYSYDYASASGASTSSGAPQSYSNGQQPHFSTGWNSMSYQDPSQTVPDQGSQLGPSFATYEWHTGTPPDAAQYYGLPDAEFYSYPTNSTSHTHMPSSNFASQYQRRPRPPQPF